MVDPAELSHTMRRPDLWAAAEGKRLVSARFSAWDRADPGALLALLHLPHVSLADTRLGIRDSERALLDSPDFRALAAVDGWDHSRLDRLDVCHSSTDKAHCLVTFGRHTADGRRYAQGHAVYIVTRRDGRWGIQLNTGTLRPVGLDDTDDAEAVATATAVVRRWIDAQDCSDHVTERQLVHLPLVELRGARLAVHRSAAALRRRQAPRCWRRSELHHVVVRERSAHKVTLEVEIAHFERGGRLIGCDAALAVITELQGRWAVQVHSDFS